MHPIKEIIKANKAGAAAGIYSCCSANKYVLCAAIERAKEAGTYLLIEATANQVDQFGGYTGMRPADFYAYVQGLAEEIVFPLNKLILGGDHLGPLTFSHLPEAQAMENSLDLVQSYVLAGFTKIHLDTSMKLASDSKSEPLSDDTVAARGAALCARCEAAYLELRKTRPDAQEPVYIIGSEVPIPGGAQEAEDEVSVTQKAAALATLASYERRFKLAGLENVLPRIIGLVVQPGVEFGDGSIFAYNGEKAKELSGALDNFREICFEAHSTDYQTRDCLKQMVEDGFSILKVGPALTFALREALFSLDCIEREMSKLYGFAPANFREVLEKEMNSDSSQWKRHYTGSSNELDFKLDFSFSDRARYYINRESINKAIEQLVNNLSTHEIPLSLLSQFMPIQYTAVRENRLKNEPQELIKDRIKNCIDEYLYATKG